MPAFGPPLAGGPGGNLPTPVVVVIGDDQHFAHLRRQLQRLEAAFGDRRPGWDPFDSGP